MLVGALIFVLGIDLVKEALWDTRNRVNKVEYLTIVSIMITMTVWDFVFGVLFGIIASCKLIWKPDGIQSLSHPPQVSSLWSKILSKVASVHSTPARLPCQPSGDPALIEPTCGKHRNKLQSFGFTVSSSLVQSRMSKIRFEVWSKVIRGSKTRSGSWWWTCRWFMEWTCPPRKHSFDSSDCFRPRWSFSYSADSVWILPSVNLWVMWGFSTWNTLNVS